MEPDETEPVQINYYRVVKDSEHHPAIIGGMRAARPSQQDATMACPHRISKSRVEAWWEREDRRRPARDDTTVCACCMGPTNLGVLCRFCNTDAGVRVPLPMPWD